MATVAFSSDRRYHLTLTTFNYVPCEGAIMTLPTRDLSGWCQGADCECQMSTSYS